MEGRRGSKASSQDKMSKPSLVSSIENELHELENLINYSCSSRQEKRCKEESLGDEFCLLIKLKILSWNVNKANDGEK